MAPAKKQVVTKALSSFVYTPAEDGSPLRPSEPLLLAMWYRDIKNWAPKQDALFPELIENGYVSIKGVTYVSTQHMATDFVNGRLPGGGTFDNPAPITYVRPPSVAAIYASSTGHAELDVTTLAKLNIIISPSQINKVARSLCNTITGTCPKLSTVQKYEKDCNFNGLTLSSIIKQDINRLLDGNTDNAIDDLMSSFVTQGLAELTIDSYEALSETLDAWNECHLGGRVLDDARMCGLHEQALRLALGDLGYLAIEGKMEAAGNNLDIVKQVISTYLSKKATRSMQDGLRGVQGHSREP